MKSFVKGLAFLPILVLGLAARGSAQLPPAPTPAIGPPGACPAVARFDFDVSSIAGANRTQWRLGRVAAAGGAVTQVDQGNEPTATGSVERDLRAFGPVLDGTRYIFRVRAFQGTTARSSFSDPAVFDPSASPDGMFTATAGATTGSLRLDWNLSGPIAGCSDVVLFRIDKADGSSTRTIAELAPSGSTDVDLTAQGTGDFDVRLHARFEGGEPEDAVGRESAPVRGTVSTGLATLQPVGTVVPIAISSFQLQGGTPTVPIGVPVTLDATFSGPTPNQFKAAPCGSEFTAASFQPFPAVPPPTLPGFATPGTQVVCYQVTNGLTSSAVTQDEILVIEPFVIRPILPVLAPGLPVTIQSFQIHGGLPFVTHNRDVPLNITATGDPTEFRFTTASSSACESALESAPFGLIPAGTPPTLTIQTSSGRLFVCVQVRNGERTSAVAKDDIDVVLPSFTSNFLARPVALGAAETLDCSPKFAIGIFGQHGKFVDYLGLRCADLGPNGEHLGITETREVIGGDGGDFGFEIDCKSGEVLFGFTGRSGDAIDQLSTLCIPWRSDIGSNGGSFPSGVSVGGTGGEPFGPAECPIPLAVTSIEGFTHFGLVGAFRFTCKTPPNM